MSLSSGELPNSTIEQSEELALPKSANPGSFFTPTYARAPSLNLTFSQILGLAQRRNEFHRHLEFSSREMSLDYQELRRISVDFGVPLRKFTTNGIEIETDRSSFFCLLMSSLGSEAAKRDFVRNEERLLYYRLKFSHISVFQIKDYFWPDLPTKDLIMSHRNVNASGTESFIMPFEKAFLIMEHPKEAELAGGVVTLSITDIYRLVSRSFRVKVLQSVEKYEKSDKSNQTLIQSLAKELEKMKNPRAILSLDKLNEFSERSFPPCMYRIFDHLQKTKRITFKARFELSLFLKGLGMDYFGQYAFWKETIFKENDAWYFESQVVVLLKQIYGLDEAEEDYTPHKCITMINHDRPSDVSMVQGCPFSYMPKAELKVFLKKMRRGIKHSEIEDLVEFVPDRPQFSCVKFFNGKFQHLIFKKEEFGRAVDFFYESEKRLSCV
jgi:hypothetical protein